MFFVATILRNGTGYLVQGQCSISTPRGEKPISVDIGVPPRGGYWISQSEIRLNILYHFSVLWHRKTWENVPFPALRSTHPPLNQSNPNMGFALVCSWTLFTPVIYCSSMPSAFLINLPGPTTYYSVVWIGWASLCNLWFRPPRPRMVNK